MAFNFLRHFNHAPTSRYYNERMKSCPLCKSNAPLFFQSTERVYYQCPTCGLIFVAPSTHLSAEEEKSRYDYHQNSPAASGYVQFLRQLADPLLKHLHPGQHGLDFGCGPGPTLSLLLEEAGIHMKLYDPFYFPDETVLKQQYDFITCTEVVEHFHHPLQSWQQLTDLLQPGGWLGVMTSLFTPQINFSTWHYPKDETHVCFYTIETMHWLADRFGLTMPYHTKNAFLFRKE